MKKAAKAAALYAAMVHIHTVPPHCTITASCSQSAGDTPLQAAIKQLPPLITTGAVAWESGDWAVLPDGEVVQVVCRQDSDQDDQCADRSEEVYVMKVQRSQLKAEAEEINLNKSTPTSQLKGLKVRAVSDKRGAPRGKTAKTFTKGDIFFIYEAIKEDGAWFACTNEYIPALPGYNRWFPLTSMREVRIFIIGINRIVSL